MSFRVSVPRGVRNLYHSVQVGVWWIEVFTNNLGNVASTLVDSAGHLIPDVIDDVFMICHYSTA
jgi:hypothetical protein